MILPITAAKTGGLCMRCVGKRAAEKEAEYVRNNRREVDPFVGLTDLVQIIRKLHEPRKWDRLVTYKSPPRPIEELYGALSAAQAKELVDELAATTLRGEEVEEAMVRNLATLTDHDLGVLQAAWVKQGEFYPDILFRGAPTAVRDAILRFLDNSEGIEGDRLSVNHALCALAWIGDAIVQRKFAEWERRPRPWRQSLHVGLSQYAHTAGWELDGAGRRDLFDRRCWAIAAAEPAHAQIGLTVFGPDEGACPWCSRQLVNMLALDLRELPCEFPAFEGDSVRVLTCDACTCYGNALFARIDPGGAARWHEGNTKPDYLPDDIADWGNSPWRGQPIQLVRRRAIEAADNMSRVDASQIGGLPSWVQDSAFPQCPDCANTMTFIAQLDNSRFENYEGVYYAFLCAKCRVTATSYQQT